MDYSEAEKVKKNDILIHNSKEDGPQQVKVLIVYKYERSIRFRVVNKTNNWAHTAHANNFSFVEVKAKKDVINSIDNVSQSDLIEIENPAGLEEE